MKRIRVPDFDLGVETAIDTEHNAATTLALKAITALLALDLDEMENLSSAFEEPPIAAAMECCWSLFLAEAERRACDPARRDLAEEEFEQGST